MTISEEGSTTLVLESGEGRDTFEAFKAAFSTTAVKAETIHGMDQNGSPVTALGCIPAGAQLSSAYREETYNAHVVVEGLHCSSIDEIEFDEVFVDLGHLQDWLVAQRLDFQQDSANRTYTITRPNSDERVSPVDADVFVVLGSRFSMSFNREGIRFSSRDSFSFRFNQRRKLREIFDLVGDLQWLVALAVGRPVGVSDVTGIRRDILHPAGHAPQPIKISRKWAGRVRHSREIHPDEMLFNAQTLKGELGPKFARWQVLHRELGAVITCYLSALYGDSMYSIQKFLLLAHALELYHQIRFDGNYEPTDAFQKRVDRLTKTIPTEDAKWLRERLAGANRKTLADRLREVVAANQAALGGLVPDQEAFVVLVRDTRNYHTHFDERLLKKGRVAEGIKLLEITRIMRALLESILLQELGLDPKRAGGRAKADQSRVVTIL